MEIDRSHGDLHFTSLCQLLSTDLLGLPKNAALFSQSR